MKLKKVLYLSLAGLMMASVGTTLSVINPSPSHARRISRRMPRRYRMKKRVRKNNSDPKFMRKPISYTLPSETKPYPQKLDPKKDRIVVSIHKQRAYIMQGHKLLYEFYVSTGRFGTTPMGTYHIQKGRSKWFYSKREQEGANYAVSWLDNGLYLFHETPSYKNHKLIKSIGRDLGRRPSSHGCIHLSTSDAQWFYNHAPKGMPVIIRY